MAIASPRQITKRIVTKDAAIRLFDSSTLCFSVVISALPSNKGYIYLGTSEVTSLTYGLRLGVGASFSLEFPPFGSGSMEIDMFELFINGNVKGDGVSLLYFVKN